MCLDQNYYANSEHFDCGCSFWTLRGSPRRPCIGRICSPFWGFKPESFKVISSWACIFDVFAHCTAGTGLCFWYRSWVNSLFFSAIVSSSLGPRHHPKHFLKMSEMRTHYLSLAGTKPIFAYFVAIRYLVNLSRLICWFETDLSSES